MRKSKNDIDTILDNGKFIKKLNDTSDNFHSEANLYISFGKKYMIKKIGRQYKLNPKKLVELEKSIVTYYLLLKKIIPNNIPKFFLTKINKKNNYVLLVTEYFPQGKVLEIPNIATRVRHFKNIIKLINRISNSKGNFSKNKLRCSIDPNPDNFFLDSEHRIIYNDFTPPLYRKNGKWVEFRRRDEGHAKKFDKETRYFTQINLLIAFINKTRLHLTLPEYLKFSRSYFSTSNKIRHFAEIFDEVNSGRVVDFDKFKKYVGRRDLLRFALSFRRGLIDAEIKEIYKKSKKPDGIQFLEKEYISLI